MSISRADSFPSHKAEFTGAARSDKRRSPRPAPFSLRLSTKDRARLECEAGGAPLGAYIKAKVLEDRRTRRGGLSIEDRHALAKALALLGASGLATSLADLAHIARIGALAVTPETETALNDALADVHEVRSLLILALGLKPEARS